MYFLSHIHNVYTISSAKKNRFQQKHLIMDLVWYNGLFTLSLIAFTSMYK